MKKLAKLLLVVLLVLLSLTGCKGTNEPETEKTLYDQIKERGYIIVGTEGTYFPNSYHDESGKLVGFDVEVTFLVQSPFHFKVPDEAGAVGHGIVAVTKRTIDK